MIGPIHRLQLVFNSISFEIKNKCVVAEPLWIPFLASFLLSKTFSQENVNAVLICNKHCWGRWKKTVPERKWARIIFAACKCYYRYEWKCWWCLEWVTITSMSTRKHNSECWASIRYGIWQSQKMQWDQLYVRERKWERGRVRVYGCEWVVRVHARAYVTPTDATQNKIF